MVKIKIIYDNTSLIEGLTEDWGFACTIEAHGRHILFDTGGNGSILLKNMKLLNIDPESIDDVVISHPHFDHIGGLSAFLNENLTAVVHVPASFKGIKYSNEVKYYDCPEEIYSGFYLSGELEQLEQAMAVKTNQGLLLIVGCSHPDMKNIFDPISRYGNIIGIVGGMHGFRDFQLLKEMKLICPTHCTQHIDKIKELYPGGYMKGGVGQVIVVQ